MDPRTRLAALLRELRELGVDELFLDELTAERATALIGVGGVGAASPPRAGGSSRAAAGGAAALRAAITGGAAAPAEPDAEAIESFEGPPGGVPTGGTAPRSLEVLGSEAKGCPRCRLAGSRTQVVFGRGSAKARLVVVGEAPGAEEDRTGLPFVGPAGKLLDLLLLSVGLERDQVYICNVLKCRPPNNRNPQPDEVAACAPWLHGQLEAIAPKVLLAVGRFSAQMLSGRDESIGRLRGDLHAYRGIPVVATYHPAYLLRTPQATRKTWSDLQLMRQVLDER